MSSDVLRGVALGFWILAGLAFLSSALFPGSTGAQLLGPSFASMAAVLTALSPRRSSPVVGHASPGRDRLLGVLGAMLTLAITLVIVREGDQRSWLFVIYAAAAAILFGFLVRKW